MPAAPPPTITTFFLPSLSSPSEDIVLVCFALLCSAVAPDMRTLRKKNVTARFQGWRVNLIVEPDA